MTLRNIGGGLGSQNATEVPAPDSHSPSEARSRSDSQLHIESSDGRICNGALQRGVNLS